MFNSELDLANFIAKVQVEGCKRLTWIVKQEGELFVVAIKGTLGESKIGSKSQSLADVPLTATSDISVSNSNKMNCSAYDLSHSFPSECFACYN